MADYTELGGRTLKDVGQALTGEGLGVAGGFILASGIGRIFQNKYMTDAEVAANPNVTNYAKAWAGNNVPKLGLWLLLRKYATSEITIDAKKAAAGSVVFDTVMRALNQGTNPASASIAGFQVLGNGTGTVQGAGSGGVSSVDVQKLIQENQGLRSELNKALQRLTAAGVNTLPPDTKRKYGQMLEEGVLQTPQAHRQKKYAFAGETGVADLTARFGML